MNETAGWAALLARYAVPANSAPATQLREYRELLQKWGSRVNLTGSTEWTALAPLFEEAVWAARLRADAPLRHLDIGSGAGFPVIPIKILNPLMHLTLVEARERRAYFLERVTRELGLRDVRVECVRLREYLERGGARSGWERASWKAVRLAEGEWLPLLEGAAVGAELWLFHGSRLPVERESDFSAKVSLEARYAVPSRTGSWLSVFRAGVGASRIDEAMT